MKYTLILIVFLLPVFTNAQAPQIDDTITINTSGRDWTLNYTIGDPLNICATETPFNNCLGYLWSPDIDIFVMDSNQFYLNESDFINRENGFGDRSTSELVDFSDFFLLIDADINFGEIDLFFYYFDDVDGEVNLKFQITETGFSSDDNFLGLPTPTQAISYVSQGVQDTTGDALPVAATVAGVPIAFVIGRWLVGFMRGAV